MKIYCVIDTTEHEMTITDDDGEMIEFFYEEACVIQYGCAPRDALQRRGLRLDPWYDLPVAAVTWAHVRDLSDG